MATFASLTANSFTVPMFVRARLLGIPHKFSNINAGGADGDGSTAYSVNPVTLCTLKPTTHTNTAGYYQVIQSISTTSESVDLTSGKSTLGSVTIEVKDWKDADGNWYLASLFAPGLSVRQTTLSDDLNRTATSISTDDNLTAGTAYFLGTECVVATSTTAVTRGAAGSVARPHNESTATTASEDGLWSRPRTFRNIEVVVDIGFDVADVDGEYGATRRYTMTRPPRMKADGTWVIKADSYWRRLDRKVGRNPFEVEALRYYEVNRGRTADALGGALLNGTTPALDSTKVFLSDGSEVITAEWGGDSGDGFFWFYNIERGLFGTGRGDEFQRTQPGDGIVLREVAPTSSTIDSPLFGFTPDGGSFTASDHPLVVFLNLVLSRDGDSTNKETGEASYDELPQPWGLGIPVDRVDVATFEQYIASTPDLRLRQYVVGLEGPESPRGFFEKEVAPFTGLALTMRDGLISLAPTTDSYPLEDGVSVDLADIGANYHDYDLAQPYEAGLITFKYLRSNGGEERVEAYDGYVNDVLVDESTEQVFESRGYDETMREVLTNRATYLVVRQGRARPFIKATLPIRFMDSLGVGSRVSLTDAGIPDADAGGYGVSAEDWRCYAASVKPDPTSGRSSVEVSIQRSAFNSAHFGPAGKVTSWDAGNKRVTIEANEFTSSTTRSDHPYLVDKDIKAFGSDGSQGGLGLKVDFYDAKGVKQTADANEITSLSHSGSTMDLTSSPGSTPQAGWYVRMTPLTKAIFTDAGVGVSADHDKYLAQANATTEVIDSDLVAFEWGA